MSFASGRSRWGDVLVASAAQFLGALSTFLVMVALILAFEQRGASGLEVAALVICEALPMAALGKPIGLLVDRVDSRVVLVVAGAAGASACLALAQATTLPAVLAGVFGLSLAGAVTTPTIRALVPGMVVRDDLPRAMAIGQTATSIGMMGGPALAGFLVGGVGTQVTARLAAFGFVAVIGAALAIRTRRGGSARESTVAAPAAAARAAATESPGTMVGWTLRHDSVIRVCVWGVTAVMAVASAVNVVLVFFVMGTLGSSPEAYGVIDAMWMVGMLAGAWLGGLTIRPRTLDLTVARWFVFAAGLVCAAIVATGSVGSPWWIVPCYLVGGVGNAALNVYGGTLVGRRVPAAARGRANAAMGMRVQAGALAGLVAGGLLLATTQPRWIVLGCGVLGLLTAAAVLPVLARVGRAAAASDGATRDVTGAADGTAQDATNGPVKQVAGAPAESAEPAGVG